MFLFYKRELSKKELRKAAGENIKDFERKIEWLQEKWVKEKADSGELRLISSIIVRPTNAINFSIISDNLDYFQMNYMKEYKDAYLKRALKLACLCGSQKITDFLLGELNANYSSEGYDFILGYACASPNKKWVETIALSMAENGTKMPNSVYGYADYSVIEDIQKIFKEDKLDPIFQLSQ